MYWVMQKKLLAGFNLYEFQVVASISTNQLHHIIIPLLIQPGVHAQKAVPLACNTAYMVS